MAEDFEANVGLFEARQTNVEGIVRHQMLLLDLLRATPQGSEVQIRSLVLFVESARLILSGAL